LILYQEQDISNLDVELRQRIEKKEYYGKSEILNFLKNSFNVFKFNEKNKISHGRLTASCFVKMPSQVYRLDGYQPPFFDEANKILLQAPEAS
jgi:hypothetical protein